MKILLIGNTRIGDFVLNSGLIAHLQVTYPDLCLTIACGYLCEPLTKYIPGVDRVISMHKKPLNKHWLELWLEVRDTHWDMIIDLRNSIVSRLAHKKKIYRLIRQPGTMHKVEEAANLMNLGYVPNPKIWIGDEHRAYARALIPDGETIIGIGPGSSHLFKQWPAENYAELCEKLISPQGPYSNAKIAILGAADERASAQSIFERLPSDKIIDLITDADLPQAAAAMERLTLYIGNDHGLMHISAAIGTRTLGLFGPTPPELYRPWGKNCSFVCSDRPQAELAAIAKHIGPDNECLMAELSVETVLAAARHHLTFDLT